MLTLTATPVASAGTTSTVEPTLSGLPGAALVAAQRPEPRLPAPEGWPFPESFLGTSGSIRVTTDGPVRLSLAQLAAGTLVRLDGRTAPTADRRGGAAVLVAAGRHDVDFS